MVFIDSAALQLKTKSFKNIPAPHCIYILKVMFIYICILLLITSLVYYYYWFAK